MKKNILICLIFGAILSRGQNVNGTAINKASGEPLPFVQVINTANNQSTFSDYSGSFSIDAVWGTDSLLFMANGYGQKTILATENVIMKLSLLPIGLNSVVISTNREQELREETPVAISSVNTETIEANKPTSIDQVLNQTPGVNMVDLGNEQHTMSIRRPIDYGASYLYLEDGIPIRTSGVFNHNALLEINMANVSRIEIVRGPASSMYGSEAIGGAVNFISKKPTLKPTAGVSVQGNNLGYKRTDFYTSSTLKKKRGFRIAGYYANQTDGLLAHSDFNKLALSANMQYNLSKKSELIWSNSFIDYYSEMGGSLDSTKFYEKSYGSNQTFTHRAVNAFRSKVAYNHYWNKNSKTNVTGFFRNNSIAQNPSYRVKDDYKPWSGTGDPNLAHGEENENAFQSAGLIVQHKQQFKRYNSSLVAGASADYSPNTYDANYISILKNDDGIYESFNSSDSLLADYQANIFNTAIYGQFKSEPIKNLKVLLGVRYDNFRYLFDNNLGSNSFTAVEDGQNIFSRVIPKIGATYQIKKHTGAYVNYSQGYVPPQVTTLYVGNDIPSLKPVYYDSYEVGGWSTLFGERARFEWSIYRMEGVNEIISVLKDDGSTQQENAGKTLHQGIEYSLKDKLAKDLFIRVSGTYAIHQFTDYTIEGTDYAGKVMPQSPNWIMNSQLTYKPSALKGFRSSIEWQHIDRYYMEKENAKIYNGYDILNLRLGYEYKAFEVWTNVMNLTDELYATVARATNWGQRYSLGRPRNVNIGLAYKFQKK
ncbi:MAG: TonB-dependent receptor [Flavobacteriales bacterium]|nr:TonB-dependent receptor [Flavobacteriales bacterium]|tara:strand:- start:6697 stop:8991 length:2295 start_codon:yes stop_codon:yes gene_type:complete